MHPFFIVGAVLHATAIAVAAFFVLFAAGKTEGWLRSFGHILGVWLLVLAVLAIVLAFAAPDRPMLDHMHRGWMHSEQTPPKPPTLTP